MKPLYTSKYPLFSAFVFSNSVLTGRLVMTRRLCGICGSSFDTLMVKTGFNGLGRQLNSPYPCGGWIQERDLEPGRMNAFCPIQLGLLKSWEGKIKNYFFAVFLKSQISHQFQPSVYMEESVNQGKIENPVCSYAKSSTWNLVHCRENSDTAPSFNLRQNHHQTETV